MPILRVRKWVEGQTIKFTLYSGKVLTEATVKRIYYKIPNGLGGVSIGYWDGSSVMVFQEKYLQYIHHSALKGNYSVFPHAEFADGTFISRSADPLQFYV